jgi:Ca2+-binding RTX toxin-like protein
MTTYKGTKGNNTISGTTGKDSFNMGQGGNDTVNGDNGNDVFNFGGAFASGDAVDGGAGTDRLSLNGDYSTLLFTTSAMLRNVELINVAAGHDYSLALFDGVIASGQSLTVSGNHLSASDTLSVDGGYMSGVSSNTTLIVNAGGGRAIVTEGPGTTIVHGGSSDDIVYVGSHFDSADRYDGAAGTNYMYLTGDYSAGLTLTSAMFKNFAYLKVEPGFSYNLVTSDGSVAADQILDINAGSLGAANSLNFDGSHETDGRLNFTDGPGNDVLRGGAQLDHLAGWNGGTDKLYGNGGDDRFQMGDKLDALDHIDGGAGNDEVDLGGDYSGGLTFAASTMVNAETLFLNGGTSYKLTMNDGNVAAGQHLSLIGDLLHASDTLIANASAETDGSYYIGGGEGDDILIGGQGGNTLYGNAGKDKMTAGAGSDTFLYVSASESSGSTHDTITGFDANQDTFDLQTTVGGIDAALTTGVLNGGQFDSNLAVAVDAGHLAAGHAMLFTPDSGNLAGHIFLVVDSNGTAGYQAGDFVVQLESATHLGSLSTGNFV